METLILEALDEAMLTLEKQVPQTKTIPKSISIIDVKPLELTSFMKDNDIPDNAYFSGRDNGNDAYDDITLEWLIDIPTTDKDKYNFRNVRFPVIVWRNIFNSLTKNGYKVVPISSGFLAKFDNMNLYDSYIDKQFDRIVEYYSYRFAKTNI